MAPIAERVAAITERMRAIRPEGGVRLMAASKGQDWEAIQAAMAAGVRLFGENRVQEAQKKWHAIPPGVELRLIGHLQTNKVKYAITIFHGIDTVDSDRLAAAINDRATGPYPVMVEVNAGREPQKSGLAPDAVRAFLAGGSRYPRLVFSGLLSILPKPRDSSAAEAKRIRGLMQETAELWRMCRSDQWPWAPLQDLSMGMTQDFEWALEAGATVIRIGEGIFGVRG